MAAPAGAMSALTSYVSSISGYIPAVVKDAAGLCPQISEEVRHITWLSVERVFWPPQESVRFLLVLGYTDGFQIWDLQDPTAVHEVVSKQDKAILQARLLPLPLAPDGETEEGGALGITAAPLMAYLHRGAPALVRLFSLRQHDDVHLLRLTEPARSLQASRRFFAVGFSRQVELYDAVSFQALFSVQCNATSGTGPTFALGQRWLAYNLPPQQPAAATGGIASGGLLAGGARQLPSVVWDGIQYLGQVSQRTLDHMLMPQHDGTDQAPSATATRGGVVAVRDAASRAVIAQFEDHTEPVEAMAWDPSGLQLVTGAALGHQILVHRALLGAEQALMMHDSAEGGLALGSVVFQHLYTLSRGYTPAVISDIAVSDNGQLVAVSSAKGTTHVFRLPPLHSATLGHHILDTGAVRLTPSQPRTASPPSLSLGGGTAAAPRPVNISACTRVRLGSMLLQEGLMPKCGFLGPQQPSAPGRAPSQPRDACPRLYVATRAGTLALYSLGAPPTSASAAAPSAAAAATATSGDGSLLASAGIAPSAGTPGAAATAAACSGEAGEWQAVLAKEVHTCRPFRHFAECRLSPRDLGAAPRRNSTASASAEVRATSPVPGPVPDPAGGARPQAAWASPRLGPQASPKLGPKASPALGPSSRSLVLGPRSASPSAGRAATEESAGAEPSKWLAAVEMTTHVPMEVPVWLCPQLSFHAYPESASPSELNATLRAGRSVLGRKRIVVSRPERPGDGVRYDGGAPSPGGEERLSRLFGGALGAAVDDMPAAAAAAPPAPAAAASTAPAAGGGAVRAPALSVAPAWGAISEEHLGHGAVGGSLAQEDGIGVGFEEVEEDWLKA